MARRFVKPTIKQVADHAGVSVATVSGYVNGKEGACSAETALRIQKAVEELHYASGPTVRGASKHETKTIGVCIEADVDYEGDWLTQVPYWRRLWDAIVRESDLRGYSLIQFPRDVRNSKCADAFLTGRIDGLMMGTKDDETRVHILSEAGLPTVVLNRLSIVPPGCGTVSHDERAIGEVAMSHLWELGHRRIAHLAGPVDRALHARLGLIPKCEELLDDLCQPNLALINVAFLRCEAYIGFMKEHGAFDPALIAFAPTWECGHAADALNSWMNLPEPPTAVWCANDVIAFDVLTAAVRRGDRIPEDLSVVGVDNVGKSLNSSPPLTTIDAAMEDIGRCGIRLLFKIMESSGLPDADAPNPDMQVLVSVTADDLIVRSITAPPSL